MASIIQEAEDQLTSTAVGRTIQKAEDFKSTVVDRTIKEIEEDLISTALGRIIQ